MYVIQAGWHASNIVNKRVIYSTGGGSHEPYKDAALLAKPVRSGRRSPSSTRLRAFDLRHRQIYSTYLAGCGVRREQEQRRMNVRRRTAQRWQRRCAITTTDTYGRVIAFARRRRTAWPPMKNPPVRSMIAGPLLGGWCIGYKHHPSTGPLGRR